MMRVAELKRFYRFHPSEFGLALVALLGVITVGILPGLGIAVVLSLLRFIWGASHLSLSRLGPVPGREHSYQVIGDAPDSIPGLEILRLDGPLFFANALRFRNEVRLLLSGSTSQTTEMPADAKQLSDVFTVPIQSGEHKYRKATKLATFQGVTYSFVVSRPK